MFTSQFLEVTRERGVAVITMRHGHSNAFNAGFLKDLRKCAGRLESDPEIRATVFTGGIEKVFSTGLDVPWMTANPSAVKPFVEEMFSFMADLLLFPLPTVAAVNGHAMAGGTMFVLVMDYRFMREEGAFISLPEINYKVIWPPSMLELVRRRVAYNVFRDLVLQGKRFYGPEALAAGIVDGLYDGGELLARSVEFAGEMGKKDRAVYAHIKRTMQGDLADMIRGDDVSEFINKSFLT